MSFFARALLFAAALMPAMGQYLRVGIGVSGSDVGFVVKVGFILREATVAGQTGILLGA